MTEIKYDVDQTLEWLRQAVAERGEDFNYIETYRDDSGYYSCRYVENDGPGCIAGQVFAYAGLLDEVREHEGMAADLLAPDLGFSHAASLALVAAQRKQDQGGTWGEALADAEREAKRLAL